MTQIQHTVSTQIEGHSWLGCLETLVGRTLVNFGEKSSENTVIFDNFSPKLTIVSGLKVPKFIERCHSNWAVMVVTKNSQLALCTLSQNQLMMTSPSKTNKCTVVDLMTTWFYHLFFVFHLWPLIFLYQL